MDVSTKQERIAYRARTHPQEAFVSLGHNLTREWLEAAYHRTRKDGAVGVDGTTAKQYAEELGENLERLSDLARSGRYKAPPVKRGYVPKPGKTEVRPIGMPGFEDKVLQRGVAMVLEPIYEQDFLDCSYGFRPGRSAHQALETIWHNIQRMGGCWLLDVDVRKFFDTLDHQHLREILDRRVRDGVIRRLIGKWLKAGVWESGQISAVSIEFTSRLVVSGTNGCDGGPAAGKEWTGNASAFLRRRSFHSPNPESSTPMRGETRA